MELTKVESTNVDAVGYLEQDGVLLVRFKDGTLYARTGVQPSQYISLLEAPSKGTWLASWRGKMVFLAKGGRTHVAAGNAGTAGDGTAANKSTGDSLTRQDAGRPSPPLTVNEMLKVKGADPSSGCDFAVIGGR